jgi:hypothetical protein
MVLQHGQEPTISTFQCKELNPKARKEEIASNLRRILADFPVAARLCTMASACSL